LKVNHYESGIIINATLEDSVIETLIEKIKTTLTTMGGEINNIDNWGRKRLAYIIAKQKVGYYIFFRYTAPSDTITKFERFLKFEESVIRYLTITLDKNALKYFSERANATQETKTEPVQEQLVEKPENEGEKAVKETV
jgi:small subunit ribosomal protein S6